MLYCLFLFIFTSLKLILSAVRNNLIISYFVYCIIQRLGYNGSNASLALFNYIFKILKPGICGEINVTDNYFCQILCRSLMEFKSWEDLNLRLCRILKL